MAGEVAVGLVERRRPARRCRRPGTAVAPAGTASGDAANFPLLARDRSARRRSSRATSTTRSCSGCPASATSATSARRRTTTARPPTRTRSRRARTSSSTRRWTSTRWRSRHGRRRSPGRCRRTACTSATTAARSSSTPRTRSRAATTRGRRPACRPATRSRSTGIPWAKLRVIAAPSLLARERRPRRTRPPCRGGPRACSLRRARARRGSAARAARVRRQPLERRDRRRARRAAARAGPRSPPPSAAETPPTSVADDRQPGRLRLEEDHRRALGQRDVQERVARPVDVPERLAVRHVAEQVDRVAEPAGRDRRLELVAQRPVADDGEPPATSRRRAARRSMSSISSGFFSGSIRPTETSRISPSQERASAVVERRQLVARDQREARPRAPAPGRRGSSPRSARPRPSSARAARSGGRPAPSHVATGSAQRQRALGSRARDVLRVVLAHPEEDRLAPRDGDQREDDRRAGSARRARRRRRGRARRRSGGTSREAPAAVAAMSKMLR